MIESEQVEEIRSELAELVRVGHAQTRAFETLVLHTGLIAQALDELVSKVRRAPKRKRKRSRRRVLKSAKWVTP